MKVETTFLRSKVARRIFLLFVSCALLPIVALTLASYYQVSGQLRADSRRQLIQAAQSQGMSIYGRLALLDTEMQVGALQLRDRQDSNLAGFDEEFRDHYLRSSVITLGGTHNDPAADGFHFAPGELQHLAADKSLLRVQPCSAPAGSCLFLIHQIDSGEAGRRLLAAEIDPAFLWPGSELPATLEACVFGAAAPLSCSGPSVPTYPTVIDGQHQLASGIFTWKNHQASYDAGYWTLLLRPQFFADSWVLVLSQKHQDALAPMEHFRQTFPLIILLALWIVMLLSLVQIRRTMVPLEKLQEGTRQVAAQNFENRVEVHSGDEFQDLASSFNSMSSRLGRQFHALKTIHDIDQAILASLNREGMVEAVLAHVSYLLPCQGFAIALFADAASSRAEALLTVKSSGEARNRVLNSPLSPADLELLQRNPQLLTLAPGDTLPQFLQPLQALGFASFLVFPVVIEQKIAAALLCAHHGVREINEEDIQRGRQVADQLAVALSNVQLIEALEQLHWGTLTALARAIDAKSAWTAGHSERVTNLALRIGRKMGMGSHDLAVMHRGGLLHDIGKIGTPPTVLDKPGRLEPEEMRVMREHVRIGLRILEPIPGFKDALPIVAQHHEWFDGSGYPDGLKGEQISIHGRIFAVADCYDAMTSDRPYRKGLPRRQVIDMLSQKSGTQFDPRVIECFVEMCAEEDTGTPEPACAASASQ